MNNHNHNRNHELIVSGIHLELTPSLKTYVREKTERLIRHEDRISRLRVELEVDPKQEAGSKFTAKAQFHLAGNDICAATTSDELHKCVDLLVDKLDMMLRRHSNIHKMKRRHPHEVEIPSELPKVSGAR